MLSLDVTAPEDWGTIRSYFVWEFGKTPDVVIEIVSNRKGEEKGTKRTEYARAGVPDDISMTPSKIWGVMCLRCMHFWRQTTNAFVHMASRYWVRSDVVGRYF